MVVTVGLVVLIFYLRGLNQHPPVVSPSPSASAAPSARALGNEKFGPHSRPQSASNVDVGVQTVRIGGSNSPSPAPRANTAYLAQAASPSAMPYVLQSPGRRATPTPAPVPTPPQPAPTFAPLAPPPQPQIKELAIVYAKGENGKRQVYLRSLDRDKDEQLVSSVYDDYGVSLSSAQQKVAYYSNEEGPSDSVKARTKLKVVDLASSKTQTLIGGLPGVWPVAWSPDGKKLAVPTANSIFIADVTTGTSLQVPTGKEPGAIVWAPGSLKFYFQAETAPDNHDIFVADGITAQAQPVTTASEDERLPSVSVDGTKVMFLRQGVGQTGGAAIVVRSATGSDEKAYPETAPADTYLFNLNLNDLVFVQGAKETRLSRFRSGKVQTVGDLAGPILVSWDRDYRHVFLLADDDQVKALFSIDVNTGLAEKIKAGISDTVPGSVR